MNMDRPVTPPPEILTMPLLKYDPPMLVHEAVKKGKKVVRSEQNSKQHLSPLENKPVITATADILNAILPPREAGEWIQFVSNEPATRFDVRNLQDQFEQKLVASKARKTGICPVRMEIYSQCFDEIIRQVAVDSAERGLLLLRARDEVRMSTAAYTTLYETSVDFGRKKAVESEKGKQEIIDKINLLTWEKEDLEKQVMRLQAKLKAMEKNVMEQQQADEKKHKEELTFLQRTNHRLKQQEETIKEIQRKEREALLAS
uniref:Inner dynein arm light chain, axonemal n=1 Tax=Eutreptiella gymnastica TaxID=73025 RepID=A0A7S1I712_9EUGL|mmetsp:Transcript_135133/g.234306  ORF Transcript_135133/g.234306 Transcript_135133/m.234306 type:complete len:259 (+) Transcript_135133:120-896(+)